MNRQLYQLLVLVAALSVIGLTMRAFLRSRPPQQGPVKTMDTWQGADAPLGYPLEPQSPFDPRMIQLSAFDRALIPTAVTWSQAMGSESGALTYNAQAFWDNNTKRGGHHSGDDLNGIGGMNTDLGDPVYAVANGLVVYRGEPSSGWGNILILAHRNPTGEILLSLYAHLDQMHAAYGDILPRGSVIGTVGTGNNHYPAHLHFELLDSTGVYIGAGYLKSPDARINPTATLLEKQGLEQHILHPPALRTVLEQQRDQQLQNIQTQSSPSQ